VGLFLLNLLPDEKLHQPVMSFSLNFKQLPQYYNNLIQQPFSRLSIQKKLYVDTAWFWALEFWE